MEVAFRVLEVNLAHTECAHGMRTRNAHTGVLPPKIIIINYYIY